MVVVESDAEIIELRNGLRRIAPPYLLRKYDATDEDYEAIADEDLRCEFADGVLIVHSPASIEHEDRIIFLATLLNGFVSSQGIGRIYGSNTVMQLGHRRYCPDLSFLAADHRDRIQAKRVMGPVDLAVEVVSESTRAYDLGEKRDAYRQGEIPEIWFFDPDRTQCHVDFLEPDGYRDLALTAGSFSSRVLPGLTVDVAWLWADPLPNPLDCLRDATAPGVP